MKKILFLLSFFLLNLSVYAQSSCSTAQTVAVGSTTVTPNYINESGTAPTLLCGLINPNGVPAPKGKWFKFVATTDGLIKVSTVLPINGTIDTRLIVYSGDCNNLVCVGSNDDFNNGNTSQLIFTATAGTTYTVAFDNKFSNSGFSFSVTAILPSALDRITFTSTAIAGVPAGNNICIVDMNGDYLDDIVSVINTTQVAISYQQANHTFVTNTITVPNTVITPSWSIAAGDYDNNGFNDLIYGSGSGVTFLKANATGTGYTTDRKTQSYLVQRTNFIDINNDGKLDAFACDDNSPNRYYINDGFGNLTHNTGGLGNFPTGGNYGSNWFDYDNDGDQDMFIAKCGQGGSGVGGNINEMHRNNGDGTFTNIAVAANLNDPEQTWSSAIGDYNNDGWMDIIVGVNALYNGNTNVKKNNGNGTFTSVTAGSGYESINDTGREYSAYDFDNDGFLDVLGAGNNIMFGNGNFHFTPNPNAYSFPLYDRPIGDLNNDGFLDIQNGTSVMYNNGNTNKWLKINLKGIQSNRNGIGARLEIYGAWGKQIRDAQSGIGFQNMDSLNVLFGIGQATIIDKLIIRWPSGIVDEILNISPNQSLLVTEGSSPNLKSETFVASELSIYPNPATDVLNISFKNNAYEIKSTQVFDITGRLLFDATVVNNSIDIKSLAIGTYVLVIKNSEGKQISKKFLKE